MRADIFCAGRAFLLVGGPVGKAHLWFLLTDPDTTGRVLQAMLVSSQPHTDKTVVIIQGDHPWVRHESNIDFGGARFFPVSKLASANAQGRLRLEADMTPELLARVQTGLLASSRTIHEIKDACKVIFNLPRP